MRSAKVAGIGIFAAIGLLLVTAAGCTNTGGADVYLPNASLNTVSIGGKPVTGLPAQTVNIVLKTGARKIIISQSGDNTLVTLEPSGAVITSSNEGISFSGVDADEVTIEWEESSTAGTE